MILPRLQLALDQHKKKILLIVFTLIVSLSSLLALVVALFFYQQQQIYTQVDDNWQIVDTYYQDLSAEENQTILTASETNQISELEQLKIEYQELLNATNQRLSQDNEFQNQVAQDFYAQSRAVLVQEKDLAQVTLGFIQLKACIQSHLLDQQKKQAKFDQTFGKLAKTPKTQEVKNVLKQTSEITKEQTNTLTDFPTCFEPIDEATKKEAEKLTLPFLDFYTSYQEAAEEFVQGVEDLKVDKTKAALEKIKLNKVDPEAITKFDTFTKNILKEQYEIVAETQAELDSAHKILRHKYLEIRLRTLFK